ncbi:MAG: hypothetical protein M3Q60_15425 [Actinomycetota bacterium]|nr:hypothetical protein [Actinomycetota bacterium]
MVETQTALVRFAGELVGFYVDDAARYAVYRTPEGRYLVHIDEGDEAWLEAGLGDGLEEHKARRLFPELFAVG